MDNWLLLLLPITLIALYICSSHIRLLLSNTQRHNLLSNARPRTFHGVTIHPCSHACEAVKELQDTVIMANNFSGLPVVGCNKKECHCTFIHIEDRRCSNDDRQQTILSLEDVLLESDETHHIKVLNKAAS